MDDMGYGVSESHHIGVTRVTLQAIVNWASMFIINKRGI
jgi:hypothetical protein